ncbi:ATP-binding protein [Caulobacter ginsengisoli]|nr:ATP-binding protein [Caulobacter ginsengisoli]
MVAAHAVSIGVLLSLQPPGPEVYRLASVTGALRSPGLHPMGEARPLLVRLKDQPPKDYDDGRPGRWRNDFRAAVAQALSVPAEDVVVVTRPPPRMVMRLMSHGSTRRVETQVFRVGPQPDDFRVMRRAVPPPGADQPGPPPPFGPPGGMAGPAAGIVLGVGPQLRNFDDRIIFAPFQIAVRQSDGRWLTAEPKPEFRWDSWEGHILATLGLSILATAPLAWLFARRLAGPITAFADAADRLGRDPNAAPLTIDGSREVTAAATAFNRMQERLRRYVEDRTAMVGAIAHDLRTPLTRLRFRIEAAPDDLRPKLESDVDQMEAMIAATMSFVADATKARERTPLELSSLVESVMDDLAETGADATVERADKLVLNGDPVALRRLVANLAENALNYGQRARARVFAEGGAAIIEIDDDGPGVPVAELERVFDPFYRGEPSRNRETGGIGLGLAVVRSVARAHGGDVTLHNRDGGGLTARVSLPL